MESKVHHWSELRVGVAFLCICSLFIAGFVKAEERKSPVYESNPKELIIYEGNLAYAKDEIQVYSTDWIQVSTPKTLITRTLNIIDGKKKIGKFYFTHPESPEVSVPGVIRGRTQAQLTPRIVKWESKSKASRKVFFRYLLTGISWSPSYTMDILDDNRAKLRYNVAIFNNVLSLSKVKVKLVSGMIGKVQESHGVYRRKMRASQRELGEYDTISSSISSLPSLEAARINAYYVYDLDQIKTLDRGTNYVVLLDEELKVEKEFVWMTSTGEKVDVIYTVKNSSNQPFASGIVDTYEKGIYMGSDTMEWTPSGSKGHVTMGGSVDIKVKKSVNITEIPEKQNNDEYHHEVELKIENFSEKDIKIKVIDSRYSDCVDIAFSIKPKEEKAQTYMWEIVIKSGGSKIIKYDFYSDNTYYKPYQVYR